MKRFWRIGPVLIVLKSPRSPVLFGERYGFDKPAVSIRGWRLFIGREGK